MAHSRIETAVYPEPAVILFARNSWNVVPQTDVEFLPDPF